MLKSVRQVINNDPGVTMHARAPIPRLIVMITVMKTQHKNDEKVEANDEDNNNRDDDVAVHPYPASYTLSR